MRQTNYLSPKLHVEARPRRGGYGVFAHEPIGRDELVAVWGGDVMIARQFAQLSPAETRYAIQVEEDLYLVSDLPAEPADYINHSCDPNAGLSGQIVVVALRDIEPGEEICVDYAMIDGTPYDEFECGCDTDLCRGWVRGDDWRRPELWQRYAGHFSPYLQRRIDRLKRRMKAEG